MSDQQAGIPTERVSDFIPGWYTRGSIRSAAPQYREAVRVPLIREGDFPIAFLRSDEFVSPAPADRRGFTIGRRDRDMTLAVPPGYWIVRDGDGELRNWRPDEFEAQWTRCTELDRPWATAVDREALDEILEEGPPPMAGARPSEEHAAAIEGWRGTRPAEGTRRALIYGALLGREVLTADECLDHADAVESALLDLTIAAEEQLTDKREELIEVHRFLDELGAPCGPEISSPTVLRRLHALVERSGSFTVGEGSEWPLPPGEYEIRPVPRQAEVVDGAEKIVSDGAEPDRPDAEILDGDGHSLGGLEVVIGARDGVPYVSLADLEHVFANLYEDITERQARKQRQEAKVGESPTEQTWPILIHTLEGDHRGDVLDYVIRGVKGEFYPCKPDIFAATYETDEHPIEPEPMGA